MLPQSFGLLRQMFSGAEMTAAIGAIGPIMALSTVGAPVLSGALIGWDIWGTSWRMIFLINIPLGLIGLAVAAVYLPKSQALKDEKLDVVGVVLAALAGGLLIYPLVQGRELGWPAWIFVLLAAAVAMSVIFVLYERRLEDRGGHPLLPRSLFQNRGFSAGLAMAVVYFSAFVAFALVFTLFVQLGLGYSPARAGIANMAPALAAVVAFGIVSGAELPQKNGRLVIQIGALVCVLGSIAVFITLKAAGTDVTLWKLTPSLAVTGLGL
jgi:MFS family permease